MKQIIVYRVGTEVIVNSLGKNSPGHYLDFLLEDSKGTIKLFLNLDDDVAKLLKLLDLNVKQLEQLATNKQLEIASTYKLMYIPGKWFSIDKGWGSNKTWTGFADLSQYSGEDDVPQNKIKMAQEVYQAYLDLGFNPTQLISPANVYRKERLDELDLPQFSDVPLEAMRIAYECCKGNWVEAFSIGKWEKVYDYDINSAYPYQASRLLDLRLGEWRQSRDYQKEATYGYCRCEVCIESDYSPIIKSYEDRNYTPKGIFETSLTKAEIDFINEWKLGYATILDGWWWFADKAKGYHFPLANEIHILYQEKQKATGVKREIVKRIMAGSFYGNFIEIRDDEFGDLFMAPYAAEIEANTRLQIATAYLTARLEHNIVNILHIAVDGIVTDQEVDFYQTSPIGTMGTWRLEHEGKAIVCSSGLVCIDSKQGKGDFSVSYDQLSKLIADNPGAESYTAQKDTVLTLAQAHNMKRIKDVGKTEPISRSIEFGDNKRQYSNTPGNFGELVKCQYHSSPWESDVLDALEQGENTNAE